jgi:xanthine dehydrogenase accessory factor
MTSWLDAIVEKAARSGALVRVVVVRAEGSTPREAGAAMIVTAEGIDGTIGGGALELDAITAARGILQAHLLHRKTSDSSAGTAPWRRETRDYPLGPSLGQCCGGAAKVLFELFTSAEASLVREMAAEEEGRLVIRPLESGSPLRVLTHRKEGYADLPINALRVTRDMLSGSRPAGAAFISGTKASGSWFVEPLSRPGMPLYLYGAGHVGRALIRVLEGLPFEVTWVDTSEDRFPSVEWVRPAEFETRPPHPVLLPASTPWRAGIPVQADATGRKDAILPSPLGERVGMRGAGVTRVATSDPAAVALHATDGALHLVMTYSHPLDLAICHAVLKGGTSRFLGLIGSKTKRTRFIKRLRELGHEEKAISRLTCPIGIAGLPGKEPATIAVSVAAQLLQVVAYVKSARPVSSKSEVSR